MDADSSEWASEPIAIIGMSCRFAGGASSPDKLWDLMAAGKSGWSEIPADRFNLSGVYHPNHERISTTHVKGGHFLDEDVGCFDAAFFSYSAETAQALDPQFRLQLESTFEALENAGLPLSQVAGSNTSVFAGVFTHDYHEGLVRDEDKLPRFLLVGTFSPMSANRISHFFDFRGASMTLETGCSTTLVALHQAMQSLRNGEADMSVVSGVNLMLAADQFKSIGSLGMLSPDGKSYAFDARANGYGRGEGVATVVIKRLSDALAANDPIRAVIRETALNQDGKTETITTPSYTAQETLMRECYRRAGLDPRDTQYFEAHGTGTQAGDPIEARAIAAVFGQGRDNKADFLRIGSVKTNVGHTEAASGLAAVIKAVLCLEKGIIPPSINYETANPKLKLDEWRLKVAAALEPWPENGEAVAQGTRRASVNNFGYGGSNAHVILESAEPWTSTPTLSRTTIKGNGYTNGNGNVNGNGHINGNGTNGKLAQALSDTQASKVLVLSARDERGCQRMVEDVKAYLQKRKSAGDDAAKVLRDLSHTLGERRTLFPWVAAHHVRLGEGADLDTVIQALETPRFRPGRVPSRHPRIGMVFTGQGAQWHAMGRELLESYPVFREAIVEAEGHLRDLGADWSLREELQRDAATTRVNTTALSIPVCVALQIALVRLLESWGITPTAVTSHSSGEISAAYAAGALTLRQAMAAAHYRAVLAADEKARGPGGVKGGMVAVGLGAEEVQTYLDRLTGESGTAVVACVNSPQSVTVAGDVDAVQVIEDMCKEDGVFARRLKVEKAYHSHHMDPIAEPYRELLRKEMAHSQAHAAKGEERELKVIFSSAVTGGRITDIREIVDPDHWVGSLVQPVQFVDAFSDMVLGSMDMDDPTGSSIDVVLEVGPHSALGGPIREILSLVEFEGIVLPYTSCLVRKEHAGDTMRTAAVNLLREGLPLVMNQINFPVPTYADDERPRVLTDLPTYPWNHTVRHWLESRANQAIRARSQEPHDLLGMPVAGNDPDTAVWRRTVRVTETPWIRDHQVQGSIVYPGSGYVCLAIEAANQLETAAAKEEGGREISGYRLRDVDFLAALVVPDNAEGVEIRTTLRPVPDREIGARGWRRFEVSSVTQDNRWTLHAKGLITVEREGAPKDKTTEHPPFPLSGYTRHKDPHDMFANLRSRGIYHGPLFQNTTKIVQDGWERRSVCDIMVRHESSTDTDDPVAAARKSVLHPITLDAVVVSFYSALPGVGALAEDPKLPRSIQRMWVSSQISREVGHALRCNTSLSHDDPQSGRADVSVVDGQTGALVLEMQGLACVFLGRGSGATARGRAGDGSWVREEDVCSRVVWGPDLSLRQPQGLAQIQQGLHLSFSPAESEVDAAIKPLSTLLRHVVHKTPGARVLEIGTGAGATTHRILKTLGTPKVPLFSTWHCTDASLHLLEDARAELTDWADVLAFDELDVGKDPVKQNFSRESYDAVVVTSSQSLHATNDVAGATANVRTLLKPGGTLLVDTTTQDTPLAVSWDSVLRSAGFSGVDLDLNNTILSAAPLAPHQKADLGQATKLGSLAVVTSNKTPPSAGFVDLLRQRIQLAAGGPLPDHLVLEESGPDAYKTKTCVFVGEIEEPILIDLDAVRIDALRAMVTQCGGLLWITTGGAVDSVTPEQSLSQGFLRVLRNEHVGRRFISLDLDPRVPDRWSQGNEGVASTIVRVLEEGFGRVDDVLAPEVGPAEFEYAERNGVLLIPRVYKDEEHNDMVTGPLTPSWGENPAAVAALEPLFQESRPLRLDIGIPGHLDTLAFVDDGESGDKNGSEALAPETVEITPRAYGLCSRDVMAAMGQLKERAMGFECAGVVARVGAVAMAQGYKVGDRVMALLAGAAFASHVRVNWHGVVKVPNGMSFEDAASLPLAFTIAHASLVDTARLGPGQSVLIHAASGSIGQAAIMVAKHLGLTEIYATVGSQEKRDLVALEYAIPAERIFSSRDVSFGPAVLKATGGRGVDVVLNSLPGPLLQASLEALAPLGHLVEIGKRDIEADNLLALASFSRGISLTSLDVVTLLSRRGSDVHRALTKVAHLLEQQVLKPVHPITIRPLRDLQAAFGLVQTGAHTGKIVLSAGPDEEVAVVTRPRGTTPWLQLRPDGSYLVVGGVGGIGRSVARWLADHGAKNLILLSRSAGDLDLDEKQNTSGALFVAELRRAGCRVKPISCDISLASSLAKALRACEDEGLPPVRGVVQGAMLLHDSIFERMTLDDWRGGLRPKVDGTWNLHTEFSQPGSLDFFVMLSSVSGILGIPSQTNYAAGGSYEDAMARWRQAKGLPGVSIDLGPIGDVGYVAETAKVAERLRKSGDYVMLDEEIVLRALNAAILHPLGQPQIIVGLNASSGPQWDPHGDSQLGRDARYLPLRPRAKQLSPRAGADEGNGQGLQSLAAQLAEAASRVDATRIISDAIASKLADIFMIPTSEIDMSKPPAAYGVDSLVAVELRNMLVLHAAADVSIFHILQSASLAVLAADVVAKSRHVEVAA